jgi:hypothetical protein
MPGMNESAFLLTAFAPAPLARATRAHGTAPASGRQLLELRTLAGDCLRLPDFDAAAGS